MPIGDRSCTGTFDHVDRLRAIFDKEEIAGPIRDKVEPGALRARKEKRGGPHPSATNRPQKGACTSPEARVLDGSNVREFRSPFGTTAGSVHWSGGR